MKKVTKLNKHAFTKERFLDICLSLATFILIFFFMTNAFSVICWLLKINISIFHLPIAFIISHFINYFFHKKKLSLKEYLIIIISACLIILIALVISNLFMDISFDGSWYHLTSIISLKNGWNPIYEELKTPYYGDVFINGYACKAMWTFGANVLAFFGNINSTKIISTLISFAVLSLSIYVFGKKAKTKVQFIAIIICSILLAFNPVFLSQLFTNYIDSTLGLMTLIYIVLFVGLYFKVFDFYNKTFQLICVLSIALMMNIKMTGLFFAAVYFGLFLILKLINIIKNKDVKLFKTIFITGLTGVLLGLFIGINPYITNVVNGHNVFYPLFGKEKIEVMGANIPEPLRNMSSFEKQVYSLFYNSSNSISREDIHLKNLLMVEEGELTTFNQDTRIGGFGPIFGLTIILTIFSLMLFLKEIMADQNKEYKVPLFIGIGSIFMMSLIFPESWWARYFVALWALPILTCIYYIYKNKIKYWIAATLVIITLIVNVVIVGRSAVLYNKNYSTPTMEYINTLSGKNITYNSLDAAPSHMFEFVFTEYFKEHGVKKITSSYDDNIKWDYEGFRVKIQIND